MGQVLELPTRRRKAPNAESGKVARPRRRPNRELRTREYLTRRGVSEKTIRQFLVGYSQDSMMPGTFNITRLVKPGKKNLLAVEVYRWTDGSWFEACDMWRMSGIFRDVYLYATPPAHVRDVRVRTQLDRRFQAEPNACPACGTPIRKESFQGSSAYYCEACQPLS